ncbi:MAG: DUF3789 domain-containing protein [Clostridiales bacterium]|nr:DUF3789 domain-containing protein [Clostridiales bacterium]
MPGILVNILCFMGGSIFGVAVMCLCFAAGSADKRTGLK